MMDRHDAPFLGCGWSFPPVFDAANASLRMVAGVANISASIDLLLSTLRGSRALLPEFGSDLGRFVFCRADAQTLTELGDAARMVLLYGEPRIKVDDVWAQKDGDASLLVLNIVYHVIQANTRHNHVYPFASLEGSNLAPIVHLDHK